MQAPPPRKFFGGALLLGRRTEEGGVLVDAAYEPTQARGLEFQALLCFLKNLSLVTLAVCQM